MNLSLPSKDISLQIHTKQYVEIYDDQNHLIDKVGDDLIIIEYEQIPTQLITIALLTEDEQFFHHNGINIKSIIKHLIINLKNKKIIAGGSTITQQLAKNILQNQDYFSVHDRSILRKLKEFVLTLNLEAQYSKEEILYMYFNRIFLGKNCYGIEAAAQYYFDKTASTLSLYESILMVALIQSPSKYSTNLDAWKQKGQRIIDKMHKRNLINKETYNNFQNIAPPNTTNKETNIKFFTYFILQHIPENCKKTDIKIKTTFNSQLYQAAMTSLEYAYNTAGEEWQADEGAFVIINKFGAIQVLIGGLDYNKSNFNIATQARRPTGSIAKFFVYLTAMEEGLNPKSVIDDSPYSIGSWHPSNYLHNTVGKIQVDVAFAQSVNSIALRLIEILTPQKVIKMIKKLDINDPIQPNLSIALGGFNTSLLNLTKSLLPIINKGYMPTLYCIKEIQDINTGEILFQHKHHYKQVLDQRTAFYMWEMLKRTISDIGTGRKLIIKNQNFGGKSGTSNQHKDLYFILANHEYAIGCWFGNRSFLPMQNNQNLLTILALNHFFSNIQYSNIPITFDELTLDDLNSKELIELI